MDRLSMRFFSLFFLFFLVAFSSNWLDLKRALWRFSNKCKISYFKYWYMCNGYMDAAVLVICVCEDIVNVNGCKWNIHNVCILNLHFVHSMCIYIYAHKIENDIYKNNKNAWKKCTRSNHIANIYSISPQLKWFIVSHHILCVSLPLIYPSSMVWVRQLLFSVAYTSTHEQAQTHFYWVEKNIT